jgi:hypothetical protein
MFSTHLDDMTMSTGTTREDSHGSLMNDVGTFFMLDCCTIRRAEEHRVNLVKKNHLSSPTFRLLDAASTAAMSLLQ